MTSIYHNLTDSPALHANAGYLKKRQSPHFCGEPADVNSTTEKTSTSEKNTKSNIALEDTFCPQVSARPEPCPETPQASQLLDDMLNEADPEQESVNGIPVAELVYMREKIRRAPKIPAMDSYGKLQELHPCPLPGQPSQPWAMLDRDTVGSDHPDSKRFWDIINGRNTPKDMLDKISKRQVKIGPKGQISFPSPQIKRPKIWEK